MFGTVTVFNCFNEPITNFSVAGYNAAASVAGWSDGGAGKPAKYTPSSVSVPRVKYAGSTAAFAIGDNAIKVPWDSFTGSATVTIPNSVPGPSPVSLNQDLMLYISANQAFLTTQFGYVIGTFIVTGLPGGFSVELDEDADATAETVSVDAG